MRSYDLGKDMESKQHGLTKKISDVVQNVKAPKKSARNKFLNYDYSTREDIFDVIRGELSSRNVALYPSAKLVSVTDAGTDNNGKPISAFTVEVTIRLVDGDSGDEMEQVFYGRSHTKDDLGIPQATTQAMRFWAVNTFMLLDGSHEEHSKGSNTGGGNQDNVHRQPAPPQNEDNKGAAVGKVRSVLHGLGFSESQSLAYVQQHIPATDNTTFADIPASRLLTWATKLEAAAKKNQAGTRDKVLESLNELEQAAA